MIDKAYADDPIAAASEWGAEFRNDLAGWLNLETIEGAVDTRVLVRPPNTMAFTYSAFADSSGGVRDSYTLGIAHEESGVSVLDCLVEVKAPFDPSVATAQLPGRHQVLWLHRSFWRQICGQLRDEIVPRSTTSNTIIRA